MDGLESKLDEVFVKNSPIQLPENAKKWIVQYGPIIGLVNGVLSLIAAVSLWGAGHVVDKGLEISTDYLRAAGYKTPSNSLGLFYYLALLSLAVQGVIYILAYGPLKAHKKSGWNLLFYGLLLNLLYAVISIFDSQYLGVGNLISGVIGFVIGGFFIFQIRSYYLGSKKSDTPKTDKAPLDQKK